MAITSALYSSNVNATVSLNTSGTSSTTVSANTYSGPAIGTGASQIDQVFYPSNPTVTSGTPLVYDFVGGGLLQIDGVTAVNLVKLCKLKVIGRATSGTATITVGGGTNPVIPAITVSAYNGVVEIEDIVNGIALTGASNDKLQITASAGTIALEIYVSGRSA